MIYIRQLLFSRLSANWGAPAPKSAQSSGSQEGEKMEDDTPTAKAMTREEKIQVLLSVYFSQRGITKPADERLSELGFGRAHHRTLTFIGLQPGCTVQELAKTLRIANQNLNRVLSPLVKQGYVEQRHDPKDLRFRRLYLTDQGKELEEHGFQAQFERLDEVMKHADKDTLRHYLDFAKLMMDPEDRAFMDTVPVDH